MLLTLRDDISNSITDCISELGVCSICVSGLQRAGRQRSAPQLGSLTNHATLQDLAAEPRHQRAETARSRSITRIDRPKAVSEPEQHRGPCFNKFS